MFWQGLSYGLASENIISNFKTMVFYLDKTSEYKTMFLYSSGLYYRSSRYLYDR